MPTAAFCVVWFSSLPVRGSFGLLSLGENTEYNSVMSDTKEKRITVPDFVGFKAAGQKITMLTAYDYTSARLVDAAGVEGVLVGDSLGMVVQGRENTLPVSLGEMIYHAEIVGRAVRHALTVVDMPFPSFHLGRRRAVANAARLLKRTRCQAVKIEGGVEQADVIEALTSAGIPVMAHCGLRPQSIHQLGGYRVQRDEARLTADAQASQQAGAFAIVLECIPAQTARQITAELRIPTIGIGAGPGCDGQILVFHDLLGLTIDRLPRHVRPFADLKTTIVDAVSRYRNEVRSGAFPGPDQSFE